MSKFFNKYFSKRGANKQNTSQTTNAAEESEDDGDGYEADFDEYEFDSDEVERGDLDEGDEYKIPSFQKNVLSDAGRERKQETFDSDRVKYEPSYENNRTKPFQDAHGAKKSDELKDPQALPTPIVTSEISIKYRQKGNEFYKKANDKNLDSSLRKEKLKNALMCYKGALKTAGNKDYESTASAAKNYAKASHEMAKLLEDQNLEKQQCYIDCISHYNQALECGKIAKSALWIDDITCSIGNVLQEALSMYADLLSVEKINVYESFACSLTNGFFSDDLYVEIATLLLIQAINSLQSKDFKNSLSYLRRMSRPIEELKRSKTLEIQEQANVLDSDFIYNLASTESLQAIHIGDKLLKNNLKNQEELSMEMVYTVIDRYREAMVLSREIEVEIEAIALSRLGSLYDKVLKMKPRASDCFKKSIELAMSLTPRVLNETPWYKEANEVLLRYQQESILEQDSKRDVERKKHLSELSKELLDLKDAESLSANELIVHIFTTYPPKSTSAKLKIPTAEDLDDLDERHLRKFIQKALLYYHPDKVDEAEHGGKWKVLCNEITKTLTAKLEVLEC